MTFKESYQKETVWYKKCTIVETLHLMRRIQVKKWKLKNTAKELDISIALVSEDLKLAKAIEKDESLKDLSRNKALKRINGT